MGVKQKILDELYEFQERCNAVANFATNHYDLGYSQGIYDAILIVEDANEDEEVQSVDTLQSE